MVGQLDRASQVWSPDRVECRGAALPSQHPDGPWGQPGRLILRDVRRGGLLSGQLSVLGCQFDLLSEVVRDAAPR